MTLQQKIIAIIFLTIIFFKIYKYLSPKKEIKNEENETTIEEIEEIKNGDFLSIENENENIFNYVLEYSLFKDEKIFILLLNNNRLIFQTNNEILFTNCYKIDEIINNEKDVLMNRLKFIDYFDLKEINEIIVLENKIKLIKIEDYLLITYKDETYLLNEYFKIYKKDIKMYLKGKSFNYLNIPKTIQILKDLNV